MGSAKGEVFILGKNQDYHSVSCLQMNISNNKPENQDKGALVSAVRSDLGSYVKLDL